jgi:signal transduction histidine kinase
LDSKEIYLTQVIDASLEVVRPAAEAKGIRINSTNYLTEMLVSGDPRRLKQVMWNILSNAVKFTPIGGRIDLEVRPDGSYAQVRVTDNGIGIRPDFLPYVFDRFRQDDATDSEGLGGLGLGLALVRYLTEMHGGHVKAESRGVGQGATFTIQLPLAKAPVYATRFAPLLSVTDKESVAPSAEVIATEQPRFFVQRAG